MVLSGETFFIVYITQRLCTSVIKYPWQIVAP